MSEVGQAGARWSRGGIWILLILIAVLGSGIFGLSSAEEDKSMEREIAGDLAAIAGGLKVATSWGRVTLSGKVDSQQIRDRVIRDAASYPGVRRVSDRIQIVPPRLRAPRFTLVVLDDGRVSVEGELSGGEKTLWGDAIASSSEIAYANLHEAPRMAALGNPEMLAGALGNGAAVAGLEIDLVPGRMSSRGELPDEDARIRVVAELRSQLPQAWEFLDKTSVSEPELGLLAEEEQLADLLEGLAVEFEPATYQLTPASELTLSRIAAFLQDRPDLRIEIAAADEVLRPGSGKRRADAIYMALMRSGVASSSLTSSQLGKEKPATGVARFRVRPR